MRRVLVTALVGVAWLPFIAHAQDFKPPSNLKSPDMIAEGRAFFNQRCAGRCHGVDGQEAFDGSILIGKAYLDPTFVFVTLITGRPGTAMPSWKGRLSDDELWKVIAFVSSLGDQARAAKDKQPLMRGAEALAPAVTQTLVAEVPTVIEAVVDSDHAVETVYD